MTPTDGTKLMQSQRAQRQRERESRKNTSPPAFPQAKASAELHRKGHPCAASLCGILIPAGATFCGSCHSRVPKAIQVELAKVNYARSQAHAAKDQRAASLLAGKADELMRRAVRAIKQKRAQEAAKAEKPEVAAEKAA